MMRKLIFLFFMLTLYLTFPTPAMSEFYYVIQLKNGGTLATPLYWSEGKQVYFFYAGGTVGVENQAIERVEKHLGEKNFFGSSSSPPKDKSLGMDKGPAEVEQKLSLSNVHRTDKKGETQKDPSVVLEFNNLEKKFASRNNMSADELRELKFNLTELRNNIASSPLATDFREEVKKLAEMRLITKDLLNIKSRGQ